MNAPLPGHDVRPWLEAVPWRRRHGWKLVAGLGYLAGFLSAWICT